MLWPVLSPYAVPGTTHGIISFGFHIHPGRKALLAPFYFIIIIFLTCFKILFVFFFLERGQGKEGGRGTSVSGCLLHAPTGDLACNPGMCPDWQLNQRPFGSQAGTQFTEPHQPGLLVPFYR